MCRPRPGDVATGICSGGFADQLLHTNQEEPRGGAAWMPWGTWTVLWYSKRRLGDAERLR